MRRIASFDGGGVRGALTACVLAEIERQTGKPCREIFAMFAGTSTGAILSASLAVGLPAEEIISFYETDAPAIFNLSPIPALIKRVAGGHAFQSAKIAAVLHKRFGAAADWTLNDCPVRILLCACGVNGHARYFVQDTAKNTKKTGKLSLVECTAASAAAPTYLDAVYVSPLGGELVGWSVDGGVAGLANPVYDACVEAYMFDDFAPADTLVLSLGTGYSKDTTVNPPNGFIGYLSLALDSLLYNAGRRMTQIAQRHYPNVKRFNWELPRAIDMADAGAIPELVALGRKVAAQTDWVKELCL